jgi:hypothetical protein
MKSYKYAELDFGAYGVHLRSTDSQVLDWILAELKKVITDFRVLADRDLIIPSNLPSGEKYLLCIDKLRDKDKQVGWWILKQLCLQGWEPFAARTDNTSKEFCYHLRLEVSAE